MLALHDPARDNRNYGRDTSLLMIEMDAFILVTSVQVLPAKARRTAHGIRKPLTTISRNDGGSKGAWPDGSEAPSDAA